MRSSLAPNKQIDAVGQSTGRRSARARRPSCAALQPLARESTSTGNSGGRTGTVGVVLAQITSGEHALAALAMARLFSAQAGSALEQALSQDVVSDELTGVGNRRHVAILLNTLRAGDAVLLLDLDHFKGGHRQPELLTETTGIT